MSSAEASEPRGVYAHRSALIPPDLVSEHEEEICNLLNGLATTPADALAQNALFVAIRFASPALASEIVRCSISGNGAQATALSESVRKYARRASQRATPFGSFAGIGGVEGVDADEEFSSAATIESDSGDAAKRTFGNLEIAGAMLYANQSARFSAEKVVITELTMTDDDQAVRKSWVRRTGLVDEAWESCRDGLPLEQLRRRLRERAGLAEESSRVHAFIKKLVDAQVLFALPPEVSARNFLNGQPRVHMGEVVAVPPERIVWCRAAAAAPPPRVVQRRIERASQILVRLQQPSPYAKSVADYSSKFLARYGAGLRVNALEATDEVHGIGYMSLEKLSKSEALPAVRMTLQNILARADKTNQSVTVSRDELFAMCDPERARLQFSTDVVYEYDSATDRVGFANMASTPIGGQSTGRFWAATPPRWWMDHSDRDPKGRRIEPVEMTCLPRFRRALNVIGMPQTGIRYISTDLMGSDLNALSVREIDMVHDGNKLWLLPEGADTPLVIRNMSMYNYADLAPALASTLFLIAREGERDWMPFPWVEDQASKFLPEILFENMVLSKAAWRVPDDLLKSNAPDAIWESKFGAWATHVNLPVEVEAGERDNLLRFDRTEQLERLAIRRVLRAESPIVFKPAVPRSGVAREYVQRVNISGKSEPRTQTRIFSSPPRYRTSPIRKDWLSVELPGSIDTATSAEALTLLRKAAIHVGASDWHFVNFRTHDDHIRFRARVPDSGRQLLLLDRILELSEGLFSDVRVTFYRPEYQRYGGEEQFNKIATSFTASSDAAVDLAAQYLPAQRNAHFRGAVLSVQKILKAMLGDGWEDLTLGALQAVSVPPHLRRLKRELATVEEPQVKISALDRLTEPIGAWNRPSVIVSTLHMHSNRFFGPAPDLEQLMINCLRADLLGARTRRASNGS